MPEPHSATSPLITLIAPISTLLQPHMTRLGRREEQGLLDGRRGGGDSVFDYDERTELEGSPRQVASVVLRRTGTKWSRVASRLRQPRAFRHRAIRFLALLTNSLLFLVLACSLFAPSYSDPPQRYTALRQRVMEAPYSPARANVNNEKVFIAASLYDAKGELVLGDWGRSVLGLVQILGPDNVHLSIYENDADDRSRAALKEFEESLPCNSSIVVDELDISQLRDVITSTGKVQLKRIAFLAEVRNRALAPLDDPNSSASHTRFDRVLYLNDVIFDPLDAANLLFSTNAHRHSGRPQYRAACAVDFINPVKFYDTFATRDTYGYAMGVPFYPFFLSAQGAISRNDVLAQRDAVRVKSCWGGMVAFQARWFQPQLHHDSSPSRSMSPHIPPPLRFRAEEETYWDASECCLIHADLAALAPEELGVGETGVFMNPYIRVAYSKATLDWLPFARRFERLYSPAQAMINWIAMRPAFNPRRLDPAGKTFTRRVWAWSLDDGAGRWGSRRAGVHGSYHNETRVSLPGSFCGTPGLRYIDKVAQNGKRKWGVEEAPVGG
ncbi:hypothetical protein LTR53_007941 [Teratosphaeriaceae sp. CCFEE 6253]|nr:hypothetical protein LTR53_007941 [Teratosphaeriaceae sp. CCFEE 6253]